MTGRGSLAAVGELDRDLENAIVGSLHRRAETNGPMVEEMP